jgi:hypothetical protein
MTQIPDERTNYGQENFRSQVSNFKENGCGPVLPGFARFFIGGAEGGKLPPLRRRFGGQARLSSTNFQKNIEHPTSNAQLRKQ